MRNRTYPMVVSALLATLAASAFAAPMYHSTDFISDGNRDHFADLIGGTLVSSQQYEEDNIRFDLVGDANGTYSLSTGSNLYHNGGDNGYTSITLIDGSSFQDVGMLLGSGWGGALRYTHWQLLSGGQVIDSSPPHCTVNNGTQPVDDYIGWSGGGFDEIRIKIHASTSGNASDSTYQAASFADVEVIVATGATAVPASGTLSILSIIGLISVAMLVMLTRRSW